MSRKSKVVIGVIAGLLFAGYISALAFALLSVSGGWGSGSGGDVVAVIRISGIMSSSGSAGGVFGESGTTAERVVDELDQAFEDDSVKAIILRIDSPGGTASSGWEIYSQLVNKNKPVVASVGDVGASAAYWAACGATEIIAGPASDVGSIGVIISIPNYKGLMDKLGISYVTVSQGKYKTIGDPSRPMTDDEVQVLKGQTEVIYRRFIEDVAKGRKLKVAEVEKLADGLAWPGSQALEMKLIDRLGNWHNAVDRAAELGKIEGEPELVEYGEPSPLEWLRSIIGGQAPRLTDLKDILSTENGARPISR